VPGRSTQLVGSVRAVICLELQEMPACKRAANAYLRFLRLPRCGCPRRHRSTKATGRGQALSPGARSLADIYPGTPYRCLPGLSHTSLGDDAYAAWAFCGRCLPAIGRWTAQLCGIPRNDFEPEVAYLPVDCWHPRGCVRGRYKNMSPVGITEHIERRSHAPTSPKLRMLQSRPTTGFSRRPHLLVRMHVL